MTTQPKPPDPSFTGKLWLNPDKTIGGQIEDVFGSMIILHGVKEERGYRLTGIRGVVPEWLRIGLVDGEKK